MKFATAIVTLLMGVLCFGTMVDAQETEGRILDNRQKSIIPIAAFTATGDLENLKHALNEGLEAGLSVNEIKEILVHIYAYAGFPRALNGINTFMSVLDTRKAQGINDLLGKEATPVPDNFNPNAYGHQVRNALVGKDISKRTSGYPIFAPVIDKFLVEHLFADIFYRDVLNHQQRELVTISVLSAMTGTDPQLKGHLRIAKNQGFSTEELEDFVAVIGTKVDTAAAERAEEALAEVLGRASAQPRRKALTVSRAEEPTPAPADHFTGKAGVSSRFTATGEANYRGAIVNFAKGARTAWHTHPLGQTLIVISGSGLVQSDGEEIQEIKPGDVVWIPAHERHWHGAAPDMPMSHAAISSAQNGSTVAWLEQVTDEEYKTAD